MKFHLRVYDNFHYMDESEAYNHGHYNSYEDAVKAAKAIIEEFFMHNWKRGMTPGELRGLYFIYGEDPVIVANDHGEHPEFSARTYVDENFEEIFKKIDDYRSR